MDLELLGVGRAADVFAVDDTRVLRRYRNGGDAEPEARFMEYARGLGYPVPEVFSASGPDIVMERLQGPTMLSAALSGELDLAEGAATLADLQARLHRLPVPREADGPCLLHLDLHPDNVILTAAGPVVIDWPNAAYGEAGLDVAISSLLFGIFAVDAGSELAGAADALLTVFLRESVSSPLPYLDAAVALRAEDENLSAEERARFGAAGDIVRERARARSWSGG